LKRLIVLVLMLGLVAGSLAAPAAAKKKKKKKKKPPLVQVDQTYYLRNTTGGCAEENYNLMLEDGEDESTCGDHANGIGSEIFVNVFGEPCEPSGEYGCTNLTYFAIEGVPFKLDATKQIGGIIAVGSWASAQGAGNGIGQTTLVVEITGEKDGESVLIGEQSFTYAVTPAQSIYEHEIDIAPDAGFDKAEFTSLEVNLYNRGPSAEHSWYSLDDPASHIVAPIWQRP
jgi:hypothetical protein